MRPSGAHTHPDGGGGLVAIVAVVIICAMLAGPVAHAVGELVRLVLIGLGALAGLGITAGVAIVVVRARRRRANGTRPASFLTAAQVRAVRGRTAPRQLPAPAQIHLHLHGPVSAADVAELLARHTSEQPAIKENQ